MIYYKYNYIKKSYNLKIKLIYDLKIWKSQTNITLAMLHVIVTTLHKQLTQNTCKNQVYNVKNESLYLAFTLLYSLLQTQIMYF